jgi:hypothetical protein
MWHCWEASTVSLPYLLVCLYKQTFGLPKRKCYFSALVSLLFRNQITAALISQAAKNKAFLWPPMSMVNVLMRVVTPNM